MKKSTPIIDTYVKQLVEKTLIHEQKTVPIYVPVNILERLNAHRVQYARHREPQHKALERILKFYEDYHASCAGSSVPNEK